MISVLFLDHTHHRRPNRPPIQYIPDLRHSSYCAHFISRYLKQSLMQVWIKLLTISRFYFRESMLRKNF
uniref:Uncharacterized protein n=1 Tax=Amphimedon queenslandica TaxID=400682 RepID=A0A1X7VCK3_AMPQE